MFHKIFLPNIFNDIDWSRCWTKCLLPSTFNDIDWSSVAQTVYSQALLMILIDRDVALNFSPKHFQWYWLIEMLYQVFAPKNFQWYWLIEMLQQVYTPRHF